MDEIVIFQLFWVNKSDYILDHAQNAQYLFYESSDTDTEGEATQDSACPEDATPNWHNKPSAGIQITDRHVPKDPSRGFVFGSNAQSCDILLDTCRTRGISTEQFSIRIPRDKQDMPVLMNISSKVTILDTRVGLEPKVRTSRVIPWGADKWTICVMEQAYTISFMNHPDSSLEGASLERWRKYRDLYGLSPPEVDIERLRLETSKHSNVENMLHIVLVDTKKPLGSGTFGSVYLARDMRTSKLYAMKRFNASQRFRREEFYVLTSLKHNHIVDFVKAEIVQIDDVSIPSLTMEYIRGGDLYGVQKRQPLSSLELQTLLTQMLQALTHIHGLEPCITHWDIKPANILVKSRDPLVVKLADFGLVTEGKGYVKAGAGTRLYAAPEVMELDAGQSGRAAGCCLDIWSLGIVALELATRERAVYPNEVRGVTTSESRHRVWIERLFSFVKAFPCDDGSTMDIVKYMLHEEWSSRPTALDCLKHPYFKRTPKDVLPLRRSARKQPPGATTQLSHAALALGRSESPSPSSRPLVRHKRESSLTKSSSSSRASAPTIGPSGVVKRSLKIPTRSSGSAASRAVREDPSEAQGEVSLENESVDEEYSTCRYDEQDDREKDSDDDDDDDSDDQTVKQDDYEEYEATLGGSRAHDFDDDGKRRARLYDNKLHVPSSLAEGARSTPTLFRSSYRDSSVLTSKAPSSERRRQPRSFQSLPPANEVLVEEESSLPDLELLKS